MGYLKAYYTLRDVSKESTLDSASEWTNSCMVSVKTCTLCRGQVSSRRRIKLASVGEIAGHAHFEEYLTA